MSGTVACQTCTFGELREEGPVAPNNLAILTNMPFCRPTDEQFHRRMSFDKKLASRPAAERFAFQSLNEGKLLRIPTTRDPSDRIVLDEGSPRHIWALLIQGTGHEHFKAEGQLYCSSQEKAPFIGCVTTDNLAVLHGLEKSAACASCIYMGCEEECVCYQAAMQYKAQHGTFHGYQFAAAEDSDVDDSDKGSAGAASATGTELLEAGVEALQIETQADKGISTNVDSWLYEQAQGNLLSSNIHPAYFELYGDAIDSYMAAFCESRWHMSVEERFDHSLNPEWNLETFWDSTPYNRMVGLSCVGHLQHGRGIIREMVFQCVKDARNSRLQELYKKAHPMAIL